MNKQIELLARQAGAAVQPGGELLFFGNTSIEKFAQLIVWKFDDILVLEHLDCVGNKDKQAVERVQRLREKVKTYFGVEE